MRTHQSKSGFTLIELLVVVAIIALLASIVLAALNIAKEKAYDAQKEETVHSVQTALEGYYDQNHAMPSLGGLNTDGVLLVEDTLHPTSPESGDPNYASGVAYNNAMQQLVSGGFLSSIPHSPDPNTPYGYYDYGPGPYGGAFGTTLQSSPLSAGNPPTCRPAPPVSCARDDLNGDGAINAEDFTILSECDGMTLAEAEAGTGNPSCTPANWEASDLSGDSTITTGPGGADYEVFEIYLSQGCSSDSTVNPICSQTVSQDYCMCVAY